MTRPVAGRRRPPNSPTVALVGRQTSRGNWSRRRAPQTHPPGASSRRQSARQAAGETLAAAQGARASARVGHRGSPKRTPAEGLAASPMLLRLPCTTRPISLRNMKTG
eukprot:7695320-Lingulodinium_polyedra.AAC.1